MSVRDAVLDYYRKVLPAELARALDEIEREAAASPPSAALLGEMRAVRTAIRVDLDPGAPGAEPLWLEIDGGAVRPAPESRYAPFLAIAHAATDFEKIRAAFGDSVLGFLGVLAGLERAPRLTARRVRDLRELGGTIAIELQGAEGFRLDASFGLAEPEPSPRTRIRLDPATLAALRSGRLDAQQAFLDERIDVEGDVGLAVGMALAALAAD